MRDRKREREILKENMVEYGQLKAISIFLEQRTFFTLLLWYAMFQNNAQIELFRNLLRMNSSINII